MVAHGSAFPIAKLALNNSVPPILMASLRMGLVFIILIHNACVFDATHTLNAQTLGVAMCDIVI